jgi:anti-repressor protein
MNEIVKLYKDNPVRIVEKDGEPWFVAKDVCSVLGIRNNRDALATLAA